MHLPPVGHWPALGELGGGRREQAGLQGLVVHVFGQRPGQPCALGPHQVLVNGRRAAPVLTAISLILSPAALSRRTSRIFLMVSLFLGTWSLLSYTGVTSEEGHVPSWVD